MTFFIKIKKSIKKVNSKIVKLLLLILLIGAIFFAFSVFYVENVFEKKIFEIKKDLEKNIWQMEKGRTGSPLRKNTISSETLVALKKTAVERYFLSEVEIVGSSYVPTIHICLFEAGKPIYPSYVYDTWSILDYPNITSPEVSLIRYLLLPEDNSDFGLNENCFMEEIKTDKDWQKMEEEYGFSKDRFMPYNI